MCLIILSRKLFSISVVIYVCIAFKFFDNCHTSVWIGLQRQRSNYWMQNIWNKAVSDNRLNVISTFCLAPRQTFTLSRTIKSICHFKSQYSPETFGSKIVIRLAAKLIMWAGTPSHHIENHWNIISLTGPIHVKTSPDNSPAQHTYWRYRIWNATVAASSILKWEKIKKTDTHINNAITLCKTSHNINSW